jgi:hypothetical protein
MSGSRSEPEIEPGRKRAAEDVPWVRSFLRTQPGKTYDVEARHDVREAAEREAVEAFAHALTDNVLRRARAAGLIDGGPDRPA